MKTVSIIIPTVNSAWLPEILAALRAQTYNLAQVEVLVIGLDEAGVGQACEWAKFIDTREKIWPAAARNLGIQQAAGDFLIFLDDDCVPSSIWLERMLDPYDRGIKVIGGGVRFPTDDYWTVCDSIAYFADVLAENTAGWRDYLPSLNFSAHRTVFEAIGLFDEHLRLGEDTELTLRLRQAGYQLWFAPDASVLHAPYRTSGRQIWQRAWATGKSITLNPRLYELLHPAPLFQHWLMIYLTAGPRALLATIKIFRQYPSLLKYWRFMPGVFLSKLAWQWGVASAFRQLHPQQTESTPTNLEIN